eukprot:gnl/TRDRNA2_/TRDRNA2_71970_c0_seq4.p1 gnl/TRDRNA2_/TRDRNA2_71970_c0~~gnl/TRDRNA2_/TRDRNA2_71970_c0_seq4.p1  ORF type:complete len:272 (+),score=57.55 gnl/TRDRNA2_/TRDRNA2_71970_c0_seq4:24-839(+)
MLNFTVSFKRPRPTENPLKWNRSAFFQTQAELEAEPVEVAEEPQPPWKAAICLEDKEHIIKRMVQEAQCLAGKEQYIQALSLFHKVLDGFAEKPAEQAMIYEQIGQVCLNINHWLDAAKAAQKAVELRPDWVYGHFTLGRALLEFGELVRAVEALQNASALAPHDEEIREELRNATDFVERARQYAADHSVQFNGRFIENCTTGFWELSRKVIYKDGKPVDRLATVHAFDGIGYLTTTLFALASFTMVLGLKKFCSFQKSLQTLEEPLTYI